MALTLAEGAKLSNDVLLEGVVETVINDSPVLQRLPFVRLLYTSTKDVLSAFVGEKKRFSQPALVELGLGNEVQVLGFLTQASAERLGIDASVVVYVPHSYAWSGQMLVLPSTRVKLLATDSAEFMAFVVSGGVTDFPKLD